MDNLIIIQFILSLAVTMANSISQPKMIFNSVMMSAVVSGLLYVHGLTDGIQIALLNLIVGYFYADVSIAVSHFLMDNYDEQSSGYKHHVAVAQTGFHEKEHTDEKEHCAPGCCAPNCEPCMPCNPDTCRRSFFTLDIKNNILGSTTSILRTAVLLLSPSMPLSGFGIVFLMLDLMSDLSGAGLPDHWSHNRDDAPYLAKLAQDFRLMMSKDDHYKHHANPKIGYAYFSPITNIVLEKIHFWEMAKWAMHEFYGMKPLNIPSMKVQ